MRCQALIRLGQFERALDDSNKALELNPSDQYNWRYKCQALLGLGKMDEANQVIQEGIQKTGN
jgi:Flp pilus assembly protein TadD